MNHNIWREFDAILAHMREQFPGSQVFIGGGAVRDGLHERAIKDVDVFIQRSAFDTLDCPVTTRVPCNAFIEQYGRDDMHGAWDFTGKFFEWPVQLILADFDGMAQLAGSFDLGICQCVYHDTLGVYLTPDFIDDSEECVLRIVRADSELEIKRSMKRIERLALKYHEFAIAPPPVIS